MYGMMVCSNCGRTLIRTNEQSGWRDPQTQDERREAWEIFGLQHTFASRPTEWRPGESLHYCQPREEPAHEA